MPRHREKKLRRAIAEKRRRLERLGAQFGGLDGCPAEVVDQFLTRVLAFETAPEVRLFDVLRDAGVPLPSPDELDDAALTQHLAHLIDALALLHVFLHWTDHLSDRELYAELWHSTLREPTVLLRDVPEFAHHIDLVGSGSGEDIRTYLKYYADEDWRRQWAEDWPATPLPAHEDPPYNRDHRLPQPHTTRRSGSA